MYQSSNKLKSNDHHILYHQLKAHTGHTHAHEKQS